MEPRVESVAPAEVAGRVRAGRARLVCAYDSPVSFPKFPLAGAVPLTRLRELEPDLEADTELVFYCRCPDDKTARQRAAEYAARGFTQVAVLAGGVDAWLAAGLRLAR
jgi:rhodanese-related sulfurtransferase